MSEKERADFVFLSDAAAKQIRIVEIKAPDVELNQSHRRQLGDYLDFTEQFHSSAALSGLLVGRVPVPPIDPRDSRIVVKGWDVILLEARAAYIDMLAGMLERADPSPGDTRVNLVQQFAGEQVWELLNRLATEDTRLGDLMKKHNHLIGR